MALTTNQKAALEQLVTDIVDLKTDLDARIVTAVTEAQAGRGNHPVGSVFRVAQTRLAAKGMREYAQELRNAALEAKFNAPEPTEAEVLAATVERVRAFLVERTRAHRDTEEIYSYGTSDGVVKLNQDDLEFLLRRVAPDVELGAEDPRVTRGRRQAAQELNKALARGDVLAGEARSIAAQEKAEAASE